MNTADPGKIKLLALDLTRAFPRSPRETLAGYVLAARMLDKCRAQLNGTAGEYDYDCRLDRRLLAFAEIDAGEFKAFVATGATDDAVAGWITEHARKRERIEIVRWNNQLRETRLSDLPDEPQLYMEDYIAKVVPKNRPVYYWFDVYDLEEERI